ncbi:MAG: trigger factor [Polyangiaceae bacterium]|nr:trigger factor [Polyangiaceae bacterium]
MQVKVEKLSPVLVELRVTVPVDRVKNALKRAYDNISKNVTVRGFRKGKVPQHVLHHMFGDRVASDVSTTLVEDTLDLAIKNSNLESLAPPQLEKPKPNPAEDYQYTARFEVLPFIDKVDYKGLVVRRPVYQVTEPMIDKEIENLRVRHSTLVAPEPPRPAELGDTITIDFVLKQQGKNVTFGEATDFTTELGSSDVIPELHAGILGKEVGAELDVSFVCPNDFPRRDMQGVAATCHIVVKEIKLRILPDVDDEFAKDVGNFGDVAALRSDIREQLLKVLADRADTEIAEALIHELCDRHPVQVPRTLVEKQARMDEEQQLAQARARGNQNRGLTAEARRSISATAEVKVRAGLLMAHIAKTTGIKITEDDVQNAYVDLAEQTGQNINKVKAKYRDENQRQILLGMILEDKILTLIEEAAVYEGETPAGVIGGIAEPVVG